MLFRNSGDIENDRRENDTTCRQEEWPKALGPGLPNDDRTRQTSTGAQMYQWKISGFYRVHTNTWALERGRHAFEIF